MKDIATVAVLGAGNRGRDAYGKYLLNNPDKIRAVAVAEPDREKRELFAREHNLARENQFTSWEELLQKEKLADGLIIATLDIMHVEPALRAMEKGYTILLEKPIAPTLEETIKLVRSARENGSIILISHVLRYTNFYQMLKELLRQGVIGRVRFVDHIENIGYFHFAHSYVRGNWRNTAVAAPIILAKSCHDLDLLYWLLGEKCQRLSSHASLEYFNEDGKPAGAADRCLDCPVESDCPYSALKIYLGENVGWPVTVITRDLSIQGRRRALREGPYGRCVFKCDNNVPEVQTVRMNFSAGIEVNFALTAFSKEISRSSRFFGTKGEIEGDFDQGIIKITRFDEGIKEVKVTEAAGGHGGGDTGLMEHFVRILREVKGVDEEKSSIVEGLIIDESSIEDSLESHLMAFAAEESRKKGIEVELASYRDIL